MSSPTPESEETRVTDAEVEAAARAWWGERCKRDILPSWDAIEPWHRTMMMAYARAALEAAAALHPPREGAESKLESLADALSAPAGICDDNAELHAHGGFCTNWRTTEAALARSERSLDVASEQVLNLMALLESERNEAEAALAESRGEADRLRDLLTKAGLEPVLRLEGP